MSNIDDDARLIGVDEKLWKEFREKKPVVEQMEFPEIVDAIDDKEAFVRHKRAMADKWFRYYRSCKSKEKKMKLIDSYNIIARQKER